MAIFWSRIGKVKVEMRDGRLEVNTLYLTTPATCLTGFYSVLQLTGPLKLLA